jgi:hypothetical protein
MHARPAGRGLLLLPAGALVVHQLRYTLAYGSQAHTALSNQGHAYLTSVSPWVAMLLAGGLGCFVARLARARRGAEPRSRTRSLARLWSATGGGLVAIYALQESLEGLLAQGHPGGLAGVFGHGGWWAIPAAAAVSLLIVLLLRAADTLVELAGRRAPTPRRARTLALRPAPLLLAVRAPLAYAAAGRAPPARRSVRPS